MRLVVLGAGQAERTVGAAQVALAVRGRLEELALAGQVALRRADVPARLDHQQAQGIRALGHPPVRRRHRQQDVVAGADVQRPEDRLDGAGAGLHEHALVARRVAVERAGHGRDHVRDPHIVVGQEVLTTRHGVGRVGVRGERVGGDELVRAQVPRPQRVVGAAFGRRRVVRVGLEDRRRQVVVVEQRGLRGETLDPQQFLGVEAAVRPAELRVALARHLADAAVVRHGAPSGARCSAQPTIGPTIGPHVAGQACWVPVPDGSVFGPATLPYGVVAPPGEAPRVGVAIGEHVLDLAAASSAGLLHGLPGADVWFAAPSLDPFLAAGRIAWDAVRARVQNLLATPSAGARDRAVPAARRRAAHPPAVHRRRLRRLLLLAATTPTTSGASSGRTSPTPSRRTGGTCRSATTAEPGRSWSPGRRSCGRAGKPRPASKGGLASFGPTRKLDIEAEVGFVVGGAERAGLPRAGRRAGRPRPRRRAA